MRARTLAYAAGLLLVLPLAAAGDWDYPLRAELEIAGPASKIDLVRK